jgi:hypothetical protein
MELSFTELDTLDKTQNKQSNYKHNTYYDDLISKPNVQQKTNYNNDYNNIVVVKKPQYNQSQRINQQPKQRQRPIINTNKNLDNKPKKKQVSYDDILSSMNTVVIDGKLEFIKKDVLQNIVANNQQRQFPQQHQQRQPHQQLQQQPQQKKVTFNQPTLQNKQPHTQLDKSSYIYNKYFKDYKDPLQVQNEPPRRPLTKNELIKQLIINKANAINERNRIAEIKSTKLLFNNNNNRNIVINSRYIPPNPSGIGMNHLFRFK